MLSMCTRQGKALCQSPVHGDLRCCYVIVLLLVLMQLTFGFPGGHISTVAAAASARPTQHTQQQYVEHSE
jgi:hypothetical protein